ncbi:uncharacterized protein H6S33_003173 [Morchella sextelata]|uniref:uncharacterized protein n=1 Tax=Morchella sextelata TaxID=1174677 RepID=UPI001D04F886|nr:uncharacterized protein H6S33_003173 [Morchella sextelata]KAH0607185.1 hypothetical protein H6S33_003173 [Morchella sextelata]
MSQDLLSEFAEFSSSYSSPKPSAPTIPNSRAPPNSRRFTSADPLGLDLTSSAPLPQHAPLHNVPLVRTGSHGHQHRASATNFDDLLAYVNNPQAPWPPKPHHMSRLGHTPRQMSYHGPLPNPKKIDLFEALGNDFSGSDGRGGRFTPPPPRSSSRNGHSISRKTTPVSHQGGSTNGSAYGSFSAPTPPPDLLDLMDSDKLECEAEDDFGDFASATTSAPKKPSIPALTPMQALSPTPAATSTAPGTPNSGSSGNHTPKNSFSGVQQYGNGLRNNTPPPSSMSGFSFPAVNNAPKDSFAGLQSLNPARNSIGTPPPASLSGFSFPSTAAATPPRNGLPVLQTGGNYRNSMSNSVAPPTPPKPTNQLLTKLATPTLMDDDDDFGDFISSPVVSAPPKNVFNTPPPATKSFSSPPRTHASRPSITLKNFAPTHLSPPRKLVQEEDPMPPVAVLLTAFPPLFLLPQTHLLDKLTALPFPLRQRVLSHPKSRDFLEGTCELGRVAGRIIAGRKRRPKTVGRGRAGSGGMKLAGGTNSGWEQQKEEREVKETCRLWGDGAGRLKAAMGAGVPEVTDEVGRMPAKVVGGCKLCGLAKSEVLPGLKERTERLGWWDAGWGGHGGCRGFWEKHGKTLKG